SLFSHLVLVKLAGITAALALTHKSLAISAHNPDFFKI
ncbi:hypothetical protein Gorai_009766, partial [Gossypium raimondii]|nr:hypothetical protein [Gossypium raimondii]